MTTPTDMVQRLAVVETRVQEYDRRDSDKHAEFLRRLDLLDKQADRAVENSGRLLEIVGKQGAAIDTLWTSINQHVDESGKARLTERMATVEAESKEHRRNISRLWRWGGGVGAVVTGAAAALARWWS